MLLHRVPRLPPLLPSSSRRGFSSKVTLISPTQLAALHAPKILDASWFMPNLSPPRSGWTEFKAKRIPGAAFFDVDVIATKDDRGLAHMLPSSVSRGAGRLGIGWRS